MPRNKSHLVEMRTWVCLVCMLLVRLLVPVPIVTALAEGILMLRSELVPMLCLSMNFDRLGPSCDIALVVNTSTSGIVTIYNLYVC